MRPTQRLLQQSLRLTLFTRDNCSLCTTAKSVLSRVWDRRNFDFRETNVMQPGQEKWKALYEYDTPVVHVDRIAALSASKDETTAAAQKLMHQFTEIDVEKVMDAVEKSQ